MERRTLFTGLAAVLATPLPGTAGDVAKRFAAALTAHDIEAFSSLFADEYQQHQSSAAATSPPPGMSAKAATRAYFAARLAALPDLVVVADPVVVAGDWVAANFSYASTHTGAPYFGVAASGRNIRFSSCDILKTRDGLIAAHWGAADIAGLLAQLKGA